MAKEGAEAADTEKTEGSKMKRINIGAAVAVVIILGLMILLLMGKDGKNGSAKDEIKSEATLKSAGYAESSKQHADNIANAVYLLQPFIVNIYDGQELRNLRVRIELAMASHTVKPELEAHLAPIRDAVIVLLSIKTIQEITEVKGKDQLKEEILIITNNIISPGKINKVYFTEFIVQ